jgi:hypothetical protein
MAVFWETSGKRVTIVIGSLLAALIVFLTRRRLLKYFYPRYPKSSPCQIVVTGTAKNGSNYCVSEGTTSGPVQINSQQNDAGNQPDALIENQLNNISQQFAFPANVLLEIEEAARQKKLVQLRVEDWRLPWHWLQLQNGQFLFKAAPIATEILRNFAAKARRNAGQGVIQVLAVWDESLANSEPHTADVKDDLRIFSYNDDPPGKRILNIRKLLKEILWFPIECMVSDSSSILKILIPFGRLCERVRRGEPITIIRLFRCTSATQARDISNEISKQDYDIINLHLPCRLINGNLHLLCGGVPIPINSLLVCLQQRGDQCPRLVVLNFCHNQQEQVMTPQQLKMSHL